MVRVVGCTYEGAGIGDNKFGDFTWMVKQEQYKKCLFLINENFLHSIDDKACEGAGTAKLRPLTFRFVQEPRAAGIPTGWSVSSGGFTDINPLMKKAIDIAIDRIRYILVQFKYDTIMFSADSKDTKRIGMNIFTLPEVVINYISASIQRLEEFNPDLHAISATINIERVERMERILIPHAIAIRDLARAKHRISKLEKDLSSRKRCRDVTCFW